MLGGFKLKKKKDKRKITFDGLNRKLPISYQKEIFLAVLVQSLSVLPGILVATPGLEGQY